MEPIQLNSASNILKRCLESGNTRTCDFCGANNLKLLWATKRNDQHDICTKCIKEIYALIENKSFISSTSSMLTSLMKRFLDKDTRDLVKAGFLNEDLSFTPKGEEVVLSIMLEKNKAELVAEAQAVIAEKEENKK